MTFRPIPSQALAGALLLLTLIGACFAAASQAQDSQEQLDSKKAALDSARQRQGVQTAELEQLSGQVERITAELAAARNREAAVQAELKQTEEELAAARDDLRIARLRLRRAITELREQLVDFYKAPEPDVLGVILDSYGYDDLLGRGEYLSSIQLDAEGAADRIRELRDQTASTVAAISAARDRIAAKEAELERVRLQVEAQQAELIAARERERAALARTKTKVGALEKDVSELERKVAAEIRAAQRAAAEQASSDGGVVPPVAAPVPAGSSSGMIWPVEGTVTSPFGPRWGRIHEGLDIAAPEGTPIVAASSGQVIMASYNGGYGNYTCIDHGGALSTCYAHQSSIGVTVGQQVGQGEEIGAVGNTGASYGAHLHFETRVDGAAQDPLGYL